MLKSIDDSSQYGYQKWKEPIELLEMLSHKHNIKPAKSIFEGIDRLAMIKSESSHLNEQISEIAFNFRIQELLEMDSQKEEY